MFPILTLPAFFRRLIARKLSLLGWTMSGVDLSGGGGLRAGLGRLLLAEEGRRISGLLRAGVGIMVRVLLVHFARGRSGSIALSRLST